MRKTNQSCTAGQIPIQAYGQGLPKYGPVSSVRYGYGFSLAQTLYRLHLYSFVYMVFLLSFFLYRTFFSLSSPVMIRP